MVQGRLLPVSENKKPLFIKEKWRCYFCRNSSWLKETGKVGKYIRKGTLTLKKQPRSVPLSMTNPTEVKEGSSRDGFQRFTSLVLKVDTTVTCRCAAVSSWRPEMWLKGGQLTEHSWSPGFNFQDERMRGCVHAHAYNLKDSFQNEIPFSFTKRHP